MSEDMIAHKANNQIVEIVSKTASLRDRIENRNSITEESTPESYKERLNTWMESSAMFDEEIFSRRLSYDQLGKDELKTILSNEFRYPEDFIPAWSEKFDRILNALSKETYEGILNDKDSVLVECKKKNIPFYHLLFPFVKHARKELSERISIDPNIFGGTIVNELLIQLNLILSRYFVRTLHLEFSIYRSIHQSSVEKIYELSNPEPDTKLYDQFVKEFFDWRWPVFFREYSILAKIITLTIDYWIENNVQLLRRITNDYELISKEFFTGNPGKVSEISAGLSDSHNKGKRVSIIKFESGLKVVYKPRNLSIDIVYSELLLWINDRTDLPDIKPLKVIDMDKYGWVRFVDAKDCSKEEQLGDFYRRIGMLICVVYLLKGNDCHLENLIANGEHPVIVDLESIMHHNTIKMLDDSVDSSMYRANEQFGDSVFRTGLLPSWKVAIDNCVYDVSGLGAFENQKTPYSNYAWKFVNSDRMVREDAEAVIPVINNVPRYKGNVVPPMDYENEIIEGFEGIYRLLLEHKTDVPLTGFKGKEVRFIFRNTAVYAFIHKQLLDPKYLRSGVDRSLQMEKLSRTFLHQKEFNEVWPIFISELDQMEANDIPIFSAKTDSTDLLSNCKLVLEDFMEAPIFDQVENRLYHLDKDDLETQVKLIKASLFLRSSDEVRGINEFPAERIKEGSYPLISKENLIDAARRIGDEIIDNAITSDDGTATWITIGMVADSEKFEMRPMTVNLYDGLCGVTLFMAALYDITQEQKYRDIAEASLNSILKSIDVMRAYGLYFNLDSIGLLSGLGSIVYTMFRLSRSLDNPNLINQAEFIGQNISNDLISKDKSFDIIGGAAGSILTMLQLNEITGNVDYLSKARALGDHLINGKTEFQKNSCGWSQYGKPPVTGFAHGTAGIAYSLLRLYEVTEDKRFMQTAIHAINYENSWFNKSVKNWRDLRIDSKNPDDKTPKYMTAWCSGGPGIALGRIAGMHVLNNDQILQDINNGLDTTMKDQLNHVDHICCGTMGRIDILLYAAQKLDDQSLKQQAYKNASYVLEKARINGNFMLFHNVSQDIFNPGFFQGLSGIGYVLLRLAYPDKLKSVLIFE